MSVTAMHRVFPEETLAPCRSHRQNKTWNKSKRVLALPTSGTARSKSSWQKHWTAGMSLRKVLSAFRRASRFRRGQSRTIAHYRKGTGYEFLATARKWVCSIEWHHRAALPARYVKIYSPKNRLARPRACFDPIFLLTFLPF